MLDKVRPAPRAELLDAWERLMRFKLRHRVPLNSTQALQCRRLLEYLAGLDGPGPPAQSFPPGHIALAHRVLLEMEPHERSPDHAHLARALHAASTSTCRGSASAATEHPWHCLVRSLSLYGASQKALQLLYSNWRAGPCPTQTGLVEAVARGLAREGNEKELLELVQRAEAHGVGSDHELQAVVILFYAARDRVPETQHWLERAPGRFPLPAPVYRSMSSFAMRNGLQGWAMRILLGLGESQPPKEHWDVLLQSVLLVGRGVGEVRELASHMVHRGQTLSPDQDTLNGLLRVAAEMRDAALASDILALCVDGGLAPDGETHLVLLQLRLATGDLAGAQDAFRQVRYSDCWRSESKLALFDEYRQSLNQFLVLLSQQTPPDFALVASLVEAVEEDQMALQPDSVAALCLRFLENDQVFDVMDLLGAHCFSFSEPQRKVVQKALIAFCLRRDTSTRRSWEAYQLLNQFFPDTCLERRTRLMQSFFDRRRPDMASQVFGHMRQHRNRSFHPTPDTYVRCLRGFVRQPDPVGLGMVHNIFKTDTTLQPTTRLYTAMMLAHTACGKPHVALDYWAEITRTPEGPSYNSLVALFWALERQPGGSDRAREVMRRMHECNLDMGPAVYNAYVGALASDGHVEDARRAIADMASVIDREPTKTTCVAPAPPPTPAATSHGAVANGAQAGHCARRPARGGAAEGLSRVGQGRVRRGLGRGGQGGLAAERVHAVPVQAREGLEGLTGGHLL